MNTPLTYAKAPPTYVRALLSYVGAPFPYVQAAPAYADAPFTYAETLTKLRCHGRRDTPPLTTKAAAGILTGARDREGFSLPVVYQIRALDSAASKPRLNDAYLIDGPFFMRLRTIFNFVVLLTLLSLAGCAVLSVLPASSRTDELFRMLTTTWHVGFGAIVARLAPRDPPATKSGRK